MTKAFSQLEQYMETESIQQLTSMNTPMPTGNRVYILYNGQSTFSSLEEALRHAKSTINMEYFSISDDNIGNHIRKILIERARLGVKVRLLYDTVGSWRLGHHFVKTLREAGVEVRAFLPLIFSSIWKGFNHRDHRKIVTIDRRIGFLGGLNIGDRYMGTDNNIGPWRDTHLKIEGEAVIKLEHVFSNLWSKCVNQYKGIKIQANPISSFYTTNGSIVQIIASGPGTSFRAIAERYCHIISSAKNRIWITTPYLIPDKALFNVLSNAGRKGIDVRIIIPSYADHVLAFWASQFYVNRLLESSVRIFSFKNGFMHAKTLIADNSIVSIGTANMDIRSLNLNYEVQAFIYSPHLIKEIETIFIDDFKHSSEELLEIRRQRPVSQKLKENISQLWSFLL